ncbi:MAG: bifunctional phosphoribosylaminoimidazolecarboxamide formyltransferase/IMP cyclohydrolase, partial [Chlorobiales bacterium]|nr:bifunctional phosphoribosylaminoimidazolecarboxamide formyltransferase/IMP cyclohydrolase [Chlorobiales bacterium]
MSQSKIKRALISVSDKTGVIDFSKALGQFGVQIYSTGGTLKALVEAGVPAKSISELTHFPEIMDGRVKTLHPAIHGGLLAVRDNADHQKQASENNIEFIDLVVVNLYPFEQTVAKPNVEFAEAIENIDIGGPSMLRSAAKNHRSVTVITDSADYARVLDEMTQNGGLTTEKTRLELAKKVFALTSRYDAAIASYLEKASATGSTDTLPESLSVSLCKEIDMRYGENPHQKAGFYAIKLGNDSLSFNEYFDKLHGKELSYNNLLDVSAAAGLIHEFRDAKPTVAIFKHTNPCGVAQDDNLEKAYRKAFSTDTQAPFGGIIVVNRPLDMTTANAINEIFTEIVIAPEYEAGVLDMLMKKKDRRLIRQKKSISDSGLELRSTVCGVLVQDRDIKMVKPEELKVVTKRQPTEEEMKDLLFAWRVCKHVKSNT